MPVALDAEGNCWSWYPTDSVTYALVVPTNSNRQSQPTIYGNQRHTMLKQTSQHGDVIDWQDLAAEGGRSRRMPSHSSFLAGRKTYSILTRTSVNQDNGITVVCLCGNISTDPTHD